MQGEEIFDDVRLVELFRKVNELVDYGEIEITFSKHQNEIKSVRIKPIIEYRMPNPSKVGD